MNGTIGLEVLCSSKYADEHAREKRHGQEVFFPLGLEIFLK